VLTRIVARVEDLPKPAAPRPRRRTAAVVVKPKRAPGPYFLVAWRDEWGECGQGRVRGLDRAVKFAAQFDGPRSWAVIIHPETCRVLVECGVRFADLQKLARKPPARVLATGGRAIAAGAARAC
jgi:hypothetical protein